MSESEPRLPTRNEWRAVGVHVERELHAGKQSRVFAATLDGRKVAVKLTDARLADHTIVRERMRVVEAAADVSEIVVPPVRVDGVLVHSVGDWSMTATAFVDGSFPDVTNADDARLLGRTLAELHVVLARIPTSSLPTVAALVDEEPADRRDWQLVHGDFNDRNTIVTPAGPRIIDFDDCGHGPVTYDVANSLYMVLFDSEVNGRPESYAAFRPAFLEGHVASSGLPIDPLAIDTMIERRVRALARWLDDLATAPIGIRTASPEWHRTLRAFVRSRSDPDPAPSGPIDGHR